MSEWAQYLSDFMVNPTDDNASYVGKDKNFCLGAALGGKDWSKPVQVPAGTTFWGAAAIKTDADAGIDTDAAWNRVYKADCNQKIMQADGETIQDTMINEFTTICENISHEPAKGPLVNGLWIGGEKHRVTQKIKETGNNNEYSFLSLLCSRPGDKGHIIICTDSELKGKSCIVTAEFDKNAGCPPSMAKIVALDFAKWVAESGTDQSDAITA